jgi:hypothetical protein
MRSVLAGAAALSLVAAPALAATTNNPAASLSVAGARAATATAKDSQIAGGAIIGAIIAAGIAAIGVIAIVNDNNDDSDSN